MIVRIAMLCCAVILAGTVTHATTSRVEALGKTGDYLEDDSNAMRWWGSLVLYPDRVIVEPGRYHGANARDTVTHQGGSLNVGLGASSRYGVLAVAVSDALHEPARPGESFAAAYAVRLGRFAPGVFFRGTSHQELHFELPLYHNHNLWQHDVGAGLRVDLGRGHDVEVGAYWRETQFSYERRDLDTWAEDIRWGTWGIRSRARLRLGERFDLIPVVDYLSIDAGALDRNQEASVLRDGEVWRIGVGGNLTPRSGQVVVFAAEYGREIVHSTPYEDHWRTDPIDLNHWNATVRLGFESEILRWLTVRGAATYQRYRTTVKRSYKETTIRQGAPTHAHLGVAFVFRPLTIDLAYGHTTPLEPGQLQADLYPDDSTTFLTGTLRYVW